MLLCVISCDVPELGRSHVDVARAALEGGATAIQLRDKAASTRELLELAGLIRRLAREAGVPFFVNDRVDVALVSEADGVHVGRDDLPVEAARRLVGPRMLVGASASSLEEALEGQNAGADYIGLGPVFATPSKNDAGPPIGCEAVRAIRAVVEVPIIAIGGVSLDNAARVIEAGADGVAVISAVSSAADMREATSDLLKVIVKARTAAEARAVPGSHAASEAGAAKARMEPEAGAAIRRGNREAMPRLDEEG